MRPQYDEMLRRLVVADVGFVLIGGLALNAWGVIRGTKDVDIVPDPDEENLLRLATALSEMGGQVHTGASFVSTPFGLAAALKGDDRVLVQTRLGDLDVVRGIEGVLDYGALAEDATAVALLGTVVKVCSLEHLRAMKRAAGRPQDLVDLADLEAIDADDPA